MLVFNKPISFRKILLNKYFIVLVVFFVYLTFFDRNNLISRFQRHQKINDLNTELNFYKNEIQENKKKMNELQSNSTNLEKFAREQYLMRKENEEIFIIKE